MADEKKAEPVVQVTKTYTEINQMHKPVIGRCNAVLHNHMQCWRAGDVQVDITKVTPGPSDTDAPIVVKTSYQLCFRHAALEKQQDDAAAAEAAK